MKTQTTRELNEQKQLNERIRRKVSTTVIRSGRKKRQIRNILGSCQNTYINAGINSATKKRNENVCFEIFFFKQINEKYEHPFK